MKRYVLALWCIVLLAGGTFSGGAAEFRAAFAKADITPELPVQMWGYFRHDRPSEGVKDRLEAAALVLDFGEDKLAIVGLDLGRAPTEAMMEVIRAGVKEAAGVNWVLISGSHTHHGPVIEMKDEVGKGRGKYDAAVAYAAALPGIIIACINEAASRTVPAKIGWASMDVDLNMNRQTKIEPKPRDTELAVIKVDALDGEAIAAIVNYAAHPSLESEHDFRFTADWPGHMRRAVFDKVGVHCIYMPGAAGDMDPKVDKAGQTPAYTLSTTVPKPWTPDETYKKPTPEVMGAAVAEKVLEILPGLETRNPDKPGIQAREDLFFYESRLNFKVPVVAGLYKQLFFPEVAVALMDEFPNSTLRPRLSTVLLNGELALVATSGEFFCQHANRLKRDSKASETFFFGYTNAYHMYFPTREAIEEGGFGADPSVAFAAVGAGEEMIGKALENLKEMVGE